jgi:hypothetical protein
MRKQDVKALIAIVAVLTAFVVSGCGEESSDGGSRDSAGSNGGSGGCLTEAEVQREIDAIASGIETSDEDVEVKQEAISQVNARAC